MLRTSHTNGCLRTTEIEGKVSDRQFRSGLIDGDRVVAVITKDDVGELLTVFRQRATRYVGITQTKYMDGFPSYVSTVAVTDNSLFLEEGSCHHGCYDIRYQFKNLGGLFKLVSSSCRAILCASITTRKMRRLTATIPYGLAIATTFFRRRRFAGSKYSRKQCAAPGHRFSSAMRQLVGVSTLELGERTVLKLAGSG